MVLYNNHNKITRNRDNNTRKLSRHENVLAYPAIIPHYMKRDCISNVSKHLMACREIYPVLNQKTFLTSHV